MAELQEELRGVELSVVRDAMGRLAESPTSNPTAPVNRQKLKLKSKPKSTPENAEEFARLEEIQGASPEA